MTKVDNSTSKALLLTLARMLSSEIKHLTKRIIIEDAVMDVPENMKRLVSVGFENDLDELIQEGKLIYRGHGSIEVPAF